MLTLFRAAPSAFSKVRGEGADLTPQVSKCIEGLLIQILVTTSYLTQIDVRQKDLQLSGT